ncbi:MAG: zinc ribbon domain-containing protein [Methanobrevibacter sp.]|uniref:double zinc ribbon domain-containing protein n=1 Tax=Methanobrevibacter sp. TaxID=66852 RepID=UPI0026E010E5|nr:zinc ribbon domain-containing protein [Methanobrevibacter sp.]MDO5849097.1 zinc ribbon domain-containing protein [Methanobrevibacter sp.]
MSELRSWIVPTDEACPNCGEKTAFSPIDSEDLLFNPPIHDIGFFNFDIDFSPYINRNNRNFNYYLCSKCGFLNEKDHDFCFNCGEKHKKSRWGKFVDRFKKDDPIVGKVTCESCGAANSPENIYCEDCGERLIPNADEKDGESEKNYVNFNFTYENPVFCFCGEENDIDSSFCINCGFPLHKFNYSPSNIKILCTCSKPNDIKNTFCEDCGISLDGENEVLKCACGASNKLNAKFCINCNAPLNPQRTIKTRYVCTCGAILDYNSIFCEFCGKDISKAIKKDKSIKKAKDGFKNIKRKFL